MQGKSIQLHSTATYTPEGKPAKVTQNKHEESRNELLQKIQCLSPSLPKNRSIRLIAFKKFLLTKLTGHGIENFLVCILQTKQNIHIFTVDIMLRLKLVPSGYPGFLYMGTLRSLCRSIPYGRKHGSFACSHLYAILRNTYPYIQRYHKTSLVWKYTVNNTQYILQHR